MILLPPHPCLPDESGRAVPYGDLDARNVATCAQRVRWGIQPGQHERLPGCGARIALCHGCGLRTRVNGARCKACGGEERPEVMHVQQVDRVATRADGEPAGPAQVVADDARADVSGPGGNGARRPAKEKSPPKPRATTRRVKQPAAGPEANDLPLFK